MPTPVEITSTAGYAKVAGIYAIVHVLTGKIYVGSASSIKARIGYHRSKLRRGNHDNQYLQNAWNLHGEASFKFFLLRTCSIPELTKWEAIWMRMTASCCRSHGYNLDRIAAHKMHCEETKQKIAASNRGKTFTDERRKNISNALMGTRHAKPKTLEQRARYSRALMGHAVSDETRAKLRAAWVRRKNKFA